MFYLTSNYIQQTHSVSCHLAINAANAFLTEFHDPRKATSDWLSNIGSIWSVAVISEEDCKATLGMDASTSISERIHATLTVGLKMAGTICLDNVMAEGQTCAHNAFGRVHQSFVTGQRSKNQHSKRNWSTFHLLMHELQQYIRVYL